MKNGRSVFGTSF